MSSGTPIIRARTVQAIAPQSASTTITGTGIPTAGFNWAKVCLLVGAIVSGGTLDVTVEESDTLGGSYAAITGAVFAQRTNALQNLPLVGEIDLRGRKAFIRVVCAAATQACLFAVDVEMSEADRSERTYGAQLTSSPPATPLTATAAAFSV